MDWSRSWILVAPVATTGSKIGTRFTVDTPHWDVPILPIPGTAAAPSGVTSPSTTARVLDLCVLSG
jgi:hypothetical protein